MNNLKTVFAAATFAAVTATASSALAVTYDFGADASSGPSASLNFTIGAGITAVASARTIDATGTDTGTAKVGLYHDTRPNEGGLGVTAPGDTNHEIDGGSSIGLRDMLLLTFNQKVKIVKASFSRVDNKFDGDDAFITFDGTRIDTDGLIDLAVSFPNFLPIGVEGTVIGFGALFSNDDYKLRSITVTPIPLPPAALLLLSGMAGMGVLARRRRKQS